MTTAKTIARSMAAADIATADSPADLARKVVNDVENHSGVRSCEWELPTIIHDYGCTEAVALRAMRLYRDAILRAAEEHLSA
jgi:hypothetical protein